MAGLDLVELVELALMLVAVGALSGFFAGIFGIGGGAILVPVFYECFRLAGVPLEVRMPLCIGTSLAIIIPTSISSFRAHHARGAVDLGILKPWWLPIVHRRHRRQRHRALRAGAAVQDRVRRRGMVGRGAAAAGARQLEIRRRPADRAPDAALRLLHRPALDPDGRRRRPVRQPADDVLRPADPSGGRDLVGARGADLDPRRARLRLCRLARGGALSRCRRAATAVCDRLCLADRRAAGDADQPAHRAARRARRACDVEAQRWRSRSAAISSSSAAGL